MVWVGEYFICFLLHKENNEKTVWPQEADRQHSSATKVFHNQLSQLWRIEYPFITLCEVKTNI